MTDVNLGDAVEVLDPLASHPCTNWDSRYTSSFCHRSMIEVHLPRFSAPLLAYMAL